jgi:nucleoid-associated protein YgaU
VPEGRACPVCGEPLRDAPERCFRCETPLAAWWPFEKGLDEAVAEPVAVLGARSAVSEGVRPTPRRGYGALMAAVAVSLVAGLLAGRAVVKAPASLPMPTTANPSLSTLPPPVPAPPFPTPSAEARAIVSYRVQPGDSLWRIAAAVTGDGRCWRQLWPELEGQLLRPGMVLGVSARSPSAPAGDRPSCAP